MDNEHSKSEATAHKERLKNRILQPGESFGNFRVVKCISGSLLANYYHMQHVRDLHDVTVGVFHPRSLEDTKCLRRLEGLQAALKTIDHPGVPQIQDCTMMNERHCIFMDAVQGQSLSEYFAQHAVSGESGLEIEEVTRILALLWGLLGHAHAQGVDHRDMDTDLIYIQEDGSIQILGLGVKATLGGDLFESIVSASVSPLIANEAVERLNSFDVMSPEYRRGIPEDPRVDIYESAYIAYWLLTGRKANLAEYEPPSAFVEELPDGWDVLLETALRREREERYQSCKGALVALKGTEGATGVEDTGVAQKQLDRIPVPKGIVARGDLATRLYRLAVIGVVGVSLTGLVASFVGSVFDSEVEAPQQQVSLALGEDPANVQFKLLPADAAVRFVGVDGVFRHKSGQLKLLVAPGDYEARISAPNYLEQTVPVKVVQEGALRAVAVELKPAWRMVDIQTEPGATIGMLDENDLEVELGTADEAGLFQLKQGVYEGTYRVVARKFGYSQKIVDDLSAALVEVPLEALPSSLTVRTEPAGANVFVNDINVGRSPVTFEPTDGSGDYAVAVQHDGFRSVGRRIQIERGEHKVVDFGVLTGRSAALDFEVGFEGADAAQMAALMSDVKVELNGQPFAYGAEVFERLPEGAYQVELVHPLYVSELQRVTVEDRVDQTLTYTMSPLPGQVEIALPAGLIAAVRVNQKGMELEDGVLSLAAHERMEVELRIENYLTMMRRFELGPNERVVWNVNPVPIPGPELGAAWTVPYVFLKFSWLDAGTFSMGSSMQESGRLPNEGPQVSVGLEEGFWVGTYEVTQAQYYKLMGENPSEKPNAQAPVDHVTWDAAKRFCEVLTEQERLVGRLPEGYVYRLPTEAEWEYAARAGTETPFAFGDRIDGADGNFRGAYPVLREGASAAPDHYGALPVGSYEANGFGLYDVHGNVAEWTLDRYSARHPAGSLIVNPQPRNEGRRVTVRGGSWEDFAVRVRSAARAEVRPDTTSNAIGFRVVLAPVF